MSDRQPQSQDITKAMPFSFDAEKGMLSCFFHNPIVLLSDAQVTVPASHFYHPGNRLLYETLLDLHNSGHPIEYIAVAGYLESKGIMDKIGGQGGLAELLDFVPTPTHYGYYRGILKDKALLRDIIGLGTDSIRESYEHQDDVPALLGRLSERYFELLAKQSATGRKSFREVMNSYAQTWDDRVHGKVTTGIPTRYRSINSAFGGITPRLWLIAGFPSDGKSTLLQNLVEDALAHGKQVLWFSYEMDETEICDRLMTAHTQLDSQEVFFPQNGRTREGERRITRAVGEMQKWPLHLRCDASWTVEQIVAESRAMKMSHNIALVAVDYLQLVPSGKAFDSGARAAEVAYISRMFKLASMSLGIPFVVLSQLNDDGKTKESRAPNQDSSNILFIEQESTVKGKTNPAGLRVVKNRNGKRGHLLPIRLCGPTFTFVEDLKP